MGGNQSIGFSPDTPKTKPDTATSQAKGSIILNMVNAVDKNLIEEAKKGSDRVITAIAPLVKAMLAIYIILQGYLMMRGAINEPIIDTTYKLVKISVIAYFALHISGGSIDIVSFFNNGTDDFTNKIMGGNGGSFADQIDDFFDGKQVIINQIEVKYSSGISKEIAGFFLKLLVSAIYFFCAICMILNWLVAKIMLTLLLIVGPIFIACLILEQTKSLFFNWLAQVVSNVCLLVLSTLLGKLVVDLVNAQVDPNDSIISLSAIMAVLLLPIVVCYIYVKFLSGIASALGGGFTISSEGAISKAIAKSGKLAKKAPKAGLGLAKATDRRMNNNRLSDKVQSGKDIIKYGKADREKIGGRRVRNDPRLNN
ncbi:MAG: type IV secretion system protein [Ostreibacterium sp.]